MNCLVVTLTLRLNTAFHTTGNLRRAGVDRSLVRNADGTVVIPATTLKGFLREKAEILLRSWGHDVCTGPDPSDMCDGQGLCLVCRVFGGPRRVSPLRFTDAHPSTPEAETAVRSGVAISRERRAAYPQHLFFVETTEAAPSVWTAKCEGHFPDAHSAREAAAMLALAAAWGAAIGSGRTRGLGWLENCEVKATIDGQPVPREALEKFWQAWKEGNDVVEN